MSVRKSLIWTGFGQVVLFASQMASQIIVARHLNPYLVGISAIAFSITDFINLMQTFGLRNFLIREADLPEARIRTAFTINLLMSLLTTSLVLALALWGAAFYHDAGVGRVLAVTALIPLVMSFELVPGALLQRNMGFGKLAIANSAKALVTAGISITMVLLGASYMSIAYGALAGAIASAVLTNVLGRRYVHWQPSLHDWRDVTQFGMHMLGISGVSNFALKATDLIIGKMLGLASLGLYSRASALNNIVWTNIHMVFTKVVFSAMADERRTNGSIREIYLKTVDMVTATLWPAFAGLGVLAGPIVHLLYGPKWVAAGPILSIFALAAMGLTATTMAWEVFVVCERTGQQTRLETIRSIIMVTATSIGSLFGIRAAAVSRVVDAVVTFALYGGPMAILTETTNHEIVRIYLRNLLLTFLTVAPAAATMAYCGWNPAAPPALVIGAVAAGGVIWFVAARFFNPVLGHEFLFLVARRRGQI